MDYIKQNTSGLIIEIQKIGCFFRSALHMAELKTGKSLSIAKINELWVTCKQLGYIGERNGEPNCVLDSAKIATLALRRLGDEKGRFVEVGTFTQKTNFYPSINPNYRYVDYLIQKIHQAGPSKTHFRNVYHDGTLEWDPHKPEITPTSIDYSILYIYL